MENLNQQIEEAKQDAIKGIKSPIYYFMLLNRMDLSVLAGYVGKPRWIVKRHFKPKVFKRLRKPTLNKYAEIFEVDVNTIKNLMNKIEFNQQSTGPLENGSGSNI